MTTETTTSFPKEDSLSGAVAPEPANHDELLLAFVRISELLHKPHSAASLAAGLPLVDNRMTADLIVRSSERIGVKAACVQRTLDAISERVLPAILQTSSDGNDGALILKAILPESTTGQQFEVETFDTGMAQSLTLSRDELQSRYQGSCIFLNPDFEPEEQLATRPEKANLHGWFFEELWKLKSIYRDVLLASLFLNLFILANPLFVMNVYDRVVPNNAVETLWVLAIGVIIVFVFDLLIKIIRNHFIEVAGKKADIVLSAKLFSKVMNLRMEAMPPSVGAFASNLHDFDSIKNFFTSASLSTLIDLPFSILFLVIIYMLGGVVVAAPVVAAILIVAYGFIVHLPLRKAVEKSQQAAAQKNGVLVESLVAVETIKAFNAEGRYQYIWEQCSGYLARVGIDIRNLGDSIGNVSSFFIQLSSVAVVVIGVYLIGEHEMSMGALIACVLLSSRAIAPMAQVANLAAQFYQSKTALQALSQVMQLDDEHPKGKRFIFREHFSGTVELQNVDYRYGESKQAVLRGLNLKIGAGEKVGIIGRIGSGKTTFLKLLVGLAQTTSGQIKIDGIDIDQIDPVDLRRNLGFVPQEVTLFKGSLRDNIVLKDPTVKDEEVLRVAAMAGLDDFVNSHPEGFDLQLNERGVGLSGGQRQSVAIARALLKQPRILLFDELTSAMDNQSESRVIQSIRENFKEQTIIVSTHRASLLALVDRVIVLDRGLVIADGPKEQVVDALKKGLIRTDAQRQEGAL